MSRKGINFKHGRSASGIYAIWIGMKDRCYNPNNRSYKTYGGRGIVVCDRWRDSFQNFIEDMGERPIGYSIERDDVNGNYEPSNCRWIEKNRQVNNRTVTIKLTINGVERTLSEWCELYAIKWQTVYDRVRLGWKMDERLLQHHPRGYRYNQAYVMNQHGVYLRRKPGEKYVKEHERRVGDYVDKKKDKLLSEKDKINK